MPEKPKSTIIEKYHRAISALPLDEQLERQEKIKSPKTLRRLLSADAPFQLIARFKHRVNEVMPLGLSNYELGRIFLTMGRLNESRAKFEKAVATGDNRGHLGITMHGFGGHNIVSTDDVAKFDQHAQRAIKESFGEDIDFIMMAIAYNKIREKEKAAQALQKAKERSKNPQTAQDLFDGIVSRSDVKKALALLVPIAEQGNHLALANVIGLYEERLTRGMGSREENEKKLEKYLKLQVQYGLTDTYGKIAELQKAQGKDKEAVETELAAIKAGNLQLVESAALLIMQVENNAEKAKKLCHEVIAKGETRGYLALGRIAYLEGKAEEEIQWFQKAVDAGNIRGCLGIVVALASDKKYDEAIKQATLFTKKDPDLYFYIAFLCLKKGEKVQASRYLQMAIDKMPPQLSDSLKKARKQGGHEDYVAMTLLMHLERSQIPQEVGHILIEELINNPLN